MLKKKKTTTSGKLILVKSVRRTRSHRMKFCVQKGIGGTALKKQFVAMDSHKHCLLLWSSIFWNMVLQNLSSDTTADLTALQQRQSR